MIRNCLLLLSLLFLASGYLIDQHNYFYLNSSFAKQTASFSLCFHFSQPTTIQFQSPLLVPQGDHKTTAEFGDQIAIRFSPEFNSELVGYNNYDSGEYWFGFKHQLKSNDRLGTFEKVKINIKIGETQYQYVFLMPLLRMPLNAFEVSPINTLFGYQNALLISYLQKLNEVDASFFHNKGSLRYQLLEKSDWGFKNEDTSIVYQRHKSKKANIVTVEVQSNEKTSSILLNPRSYPSGPLSLPNEEFAFTLNQLLSFSTPISELPQEL